MTNDEADELGLLDDLADEVTYLWMPTQRRVAVHR